MAYGMAKVTIASSGKITAKMTLPCGTYSFSAANWTSVKAGKYSAVLKAKSGEEFKLVIDSKRDWRDVAGESALKIKGYDRFDVPLWRNEHGKGGYIESDSYACNLISDIKAMKKLFFKVSGSKKKGYTVREVGVNDKNANLTVSFDSNGNVTYLGTVDGVRVSGSTFLCIDDDCYYTICDLVISVGEKESMYIPFGIEREWNGDISLEMEVYRVDFK
jgi:hypothetical protein